mmetsp:Transcript_12243/g.24889  ORF Transcript_12243/g.24889 Transcript_12243/m.24889 type:complete len:397 (-) Transcript_12243:174-1364(-)|eukprot:CAMPEP_0171371494 /NCGR_PEP_ID=MMETSP0879-20121228/8680_1 /TAXON_ID=67004 /ORGANISM="Thalassiosira weissflogii, Strain CCMP1336" /LENGTH=396 /DNA_ID=CAMNT_0011880105 /DNA_START=13 /DNA_END=1203 /DNA_ORIENTATION=-
MSFNLTKDEVADYVSNHNSEINFFPPESTLVAEAIQGGNVNFAFCVRESGGDRAVFVKQAPEYVAVFGPDGLPLTSTRIQREVAIMNEWSSILGEDADKYLPKLYFFDDANKVFVMEFLENYSLLDHHLVSNPSHNSGLSIASQLGIFMAKTHLATHSSRVTPERAALLTEEYENRELRDIQLEFVFTRAYKDLPKTTHNGYPVDEQFLKEVNELKSRYNGEVGVGNMSLCHGDLHPGSVMVKVEEDSAQVRVIDPEFTVYGPPGLDVGSLFSGYILAALHEKYSDRNEEEKMKHISSISNGVVEAWDAYKNVLVDGGISEELVKEIEIETVGFAVAEVTRTALGHAGVRLWLQFDDPEVKDAAIQTALTLARKCIVARHGEGIQVLFDSLNELTN